MAISFLPEPKLMLYHQPEFYHFNEDSLFLAKEVLANIPIQLNRREFVIFLLVAEFWY